MLYFGDTAGNGVKASTFVTELHSRADFEKFLMQQDEKVRRSRGMRGFVVAAWGLSLLLLLQLQALPATSSLCCCSPCS